MEINARTKTKTPKCRGQSLHHDLLACVCLTSHSRERNTLLSLKHQHEHCIDKSNSSSKLPKGLEQI